MIDWFILLQTLEQNQAYTEEEMREFEEHLTRQEQDLNQKTAELQKQRDELERQQEQLNAQKIELQQVGSKIRTPCRASHRFIRLVVCIELRRVSA